MDEDRIARLKRDVLLLDRAFNVLDRDLVIVAKHRDAFVAGNVDEHAARDQGPDVLDAELVEAGPGHDVTGLEAVVVAAGMALMREAVELGADLSNLRQHHLLVGDAVVSAGDWARNLDMH